MKHALLPTALLLSVACTQAPPPRVASLRPPTLAKPALPDPEPFRAVKPAAGEPARFQYPAPELFKLTNGLSVYVVDRPSRVVALELVIRHGAASVELGKSGLAGLTARMLIESTRSKGPTALAEAVESLGTTLGSGANRDASDLSMTVLPGDVPRALALLSEVVTSPAFASSEFERIRAEWLDGVRSERQDPQRLATLASVRALMGPVWGAPVDGRVQDLERLTVADLRDFHAKAYTPDHAALVVVGPMNSGQLRPALERAFANWRGKSRITIAPAPLPTPPETTKVVIIDRAGAVQSAIVALQQFPKRSEPGFEVRQLLGRILGGLFTSRLNTNLREKHAFTYGAAAQPVANRNFGALVVSTSVRTDATAPALDQILSELRKLSDSKSDAPIQNDELERAQADLVFGLGSTLEHPSRIAEVVSELFVDELPLDYDARYPETIRGVSKDQVAAAAAAITPTRLLVVVVGDRSKIQAELERHGYAVEAATDALSE